MAVSVPILAIVVSLHLIAFVLAVGAERRRSLVTLLISGFLVQKSSELFIFYFYFYFLGCGVNKMSFCEG